jgi:hypothetical protein
MEQKYCLNEEVGIVVPIYEAADPRTALRMEQAHTWILTVFVVGLPFLALLVLNTFIIRAIFRQEIKNIYLYIYLFNTHKACQGHISSSSEWPWGTRADIG